MPKSNRHRVRSWLICAAICVVLAAPALIGYVRWALRFADTMIQPFWLIGSAWGGWEPGPEARCPCVLRATVWHVKV